MDAVMARFMKAHGTANATKKATTPHPISSITLAIDMPVGDGLLSSGRLSISQMTIKGLPCSGVGSCATVGIGVRSCTAVGTTDVGSSAAVGGIAVGSCTAVGCGLLNEP